MSTTVTDDYKKIFTQGLFNEFNNVNAQVGDSDTFYMAIGRSEPWPLGDSDDGVIAPNGSKSYGKVFQDSLQSIKKIDDCSYVVRRYDWSANSVYLAWDDEYSTNTDVLGDNDDLTDAEDIPFPFYVFTPNNSNVYVCLKQGKTASGIARNSIIQPTAAATDAFELDDGYVWKYLYTVSAPDTRKFLTSEYMPVKFVDSAETYETSADAAQKTNQDGAIPGQILGIQVADGGTGFTSAPTLTIEGDGSNAAAYAVVSGGQIVDVVMKNNALDTELRFGSGYTYASVKITGGNGTGAQLRPVLAPTGGLGADPRIDLKSAGLMFSAQLEGDEDGKFLTSPEFRQFGILKNPQKWETTQPGFSGDSDFTEIAGNCFRKAKYTSASGGQIVDTIGQIFTTASGSQGFIDDINTGTSIIYFHQNEETGFGTIDEAAGQWTSQGVTISLEAGWDANYDSADFARYSGEVLYIDNRTPISRNPGQTEDVKIVIDI